MPNRTPKSMIASTRLSSAFAIVVLALVLAGCGSKEGPSLGDWTLKTNDLTLTEDLRVSETAAFFFGTIADMDVTSDGRIVVADRDANHLKILRPDGTLLDTLGGPGEGPGEFQMLSSLQATRGDSLYAYDVMHSRLSVFGPDAPYAPERSVSISQEEGRVSRMWVLEDGFLGLHAATAPPTDPTEPRYAPLYRYDPDGTPRDSVARWRLGQLVVHRYENGGFTAESLPFGRSSELSIGPDRRLYTGWTDALTVHAYGPDGTVDTVAAVPAEPPPVSDAEQEAALADIDSDELRATAKKYMPDTKPAFTDLVVAADGQLWVKRPTEDPDADTAPWWVLDPDAKTIREGQLPADVDLEVVRDGQAYGTTTTEAGAPAVVRYTLDRET